MKTNKLFKINLGLSVGMLLFIVCEYFVLHYTMGGTSGLSGTAWFSNFVLLIGFIFGVRGFISGRKVNRNLSIACLISSIGVLLNVKFAIAGSVMTFEDPFGIALSISSGVFLLIAFGMLVFGLLADKDKAK